METKLHARMSELLNLFTVLTTIKNRGGNRKMLKILYKRNSHLEIVNRSIKNCKHSCLFEQLFYRSSHWVPLNSQKHVQRVATCLERRIQSWVSMIQRLNARKALFDRKRKEGRKTARRFRFQTFYFIFQFHYYKRSLQRLHYITKARKKQNSKLHKSLKVKMCTVTKGAQEFELVNATSN